jgi:hypothetical protein
VRRTAIICASKSIEGATAKAGTPVAVATCIAVVALMIAENRGELIRCCCCCCWLDVEVRRAAAAATVVIAADDEAEAPRGCSCGLAIAPAGVCVARSEGLGAATAPAGVLILCAFAPAPAVTAGRDARRTDVDDSIDVSRTVLLVLLLLAVATDPAPAARLLIVCASDDTESVRTGRFGEARTDGEPAEDGRRDIGSRC